MFTSRESRLFIIQQLQEQHGWHAAIPLQGAETVQLTQQWCKFVFSISEATWGSKSISKSWGLNRAKNMIRTIQLKLSFNKNKETKTFLGAVLPFSIISLAVVIPAVFPTGSAPYA